MGKVYKKGFYIYDKNLDDFIPVMSGSKVFTDVPGLPIYDIDTQTIYRISNSVWAHNGEEIKDYYPSGFRIIDTDNIQISETGITINGADEILWGNLTIIDLEEPMQNGQIEYTDMVLTPDFAQYGEDKYDIFTHFSYEMKYKLYHNPTGNQSEYKEIPESGGDDDDYVKKSTFLNTIFPTGTVLFTYDKVSPEIYIGGEWELIEEGYYPVSTIHDTINERLLNAELPNIKGKWGGAASRSLRNIEGAFTGTTQVLHAVNWGGSGNDDHVTITPFDASNGQVNEDGTTFVLQEESVYKDGGKVQPKSILLYMWRRVDNGILTYNFVNISFSESDFIVNPITGQISLRNAIYYYTPNNIPKADETGKLIDSGININDIVLNTRKVAGIPLDHDITAQEIQDAIKDIEVELKNKTINADNNNITNLETDNFKDTALAKSTDDVRNYENSSDTKATTEKFLQKTLRNIPTPTENNHASNKKYVDDEVRKVIESTFTFKGFISLTEPAGTIKVGSFWYESETLPTTFPINVKTYDGTNWSSTTSEYTPSQFDYWINVKEDHNYYWNGNKWRMFDSEVLVDNVTIEKNNEGRIEVKDNGITFSKFNQELTKQSLANDYYFKFSDSTNTYYTKTIVDGENIDVYSITITSNKITSITLQETKGALANGALTFNSVEYAHNVFGDGFYVVGDDEILITISALQDILEKAGKVNDIKIANKSIVKDKEANIETIDNVEDNYYYSWKSGSNYIYTKTKTIGTNVNTYLFTFTDNVITKIELSDKKSEIKLNDNGTLVSVYDSVSYGHDYSKSDYYIIDSKYKLPSIENETRDLTEEELNRILNGLYLIPPNESWRYVGILPASNGSTLKIEDDWDELLLVARVSEGSAYYNLTSVIPKYGFTYGAPNGNNTFAGFFWNESYNCKLRVGLEGTGANRVVKQNYSNAVGWALNGTYVFKR